MQIDPNELESIENKMALCRENPPLYESWNANIEHDESEETQEGYNLTPKRVAGYKLTPKRVAEREREMQGRR